MSSLDHSQGLLAFVRAVQAGSFSGAARLLGVAPSAVSKGVARLEARLGVRLFQRSTRTLTLTREGAAYHERIEPLLRALDEATDSLQSPMAAQGQLRVSMPAAIGRGLTELLTRDFVPRHPRLKLDIGMTDRHVDLIREGYDVAIRVGPAADSELNARLLTEVPLVLVAAPGYLGLHGEPDSIEALSGHRHVRYVHGGRPYPIRFADGRAITPEGVLDTDSGDVLRIAALNGVGIIQVMRSAVDDEIRRGALVVVLPDEPLPTVPVHALHAFGRHTPNRVRALIDFLLECFDTRSRIA